MSAQIHDSEVPKLDVRIEAGERGSEITLIDSSFNAIYSAVETLDVTLLPGFYKVRFKAGDRIEDQLFEVATGPMLIKGRPLEFSSPIPMEGTSNNHEYQHYPALGLATAATATISGIGAEILIFVRDSKQINGMPPIDPAPWNDLKLRRFDGAVISDIESGIVNPHEGHAGIRVSVNPGTYYVSTPVPSARDLTLNLAVIARAGLATHVYIDSRDTYASRATDSGTTPIYRTADLSGASIVMVELDKSAQVLTSELTRLTEVARQAFLFDQDSISKNDVQAMIHGKLQFPMLGLYAVHLLLRRDPVPWPLVKEMTENLQTLLGDSNADVRIFSNAWARRNDPRAVTPSVPWPPILSLSWDLAIKNGEAWQFDSDADVLRQYRVGGSLWTCFQLSWKSLEARFDQKIVMQTSSLTRTTAPPPNLSEYLNLFAAPESAPPRARKSLWSSLLVLPLFSAFGSVVPDSNYPTTGQLRIRILAGLQTPNPHHTPFQQALRRLLLNTFVTPDESTSPSRFEHNFKELAKQFRLGDERSIEALGQLTQEASNMKAPNS